MNRLVVFALGSLACACSDTESAPSARLLPIADCGEAAAYVKDVAIQRMNENIDAMLQSYISGNHCSYGGEDQSPTSGGSGNGSGGGGPTQGTGTNNQVSGVDEADFVKNDGQYLYLAQNGALRIVDAWPADQAHTVSTTPLEGTMRKLFVDGDKALVYAALGQNDNNYYQRDCTYGYDCDFSGDGTNTRLYMFDISNRAAPVLERQIDLTGSLIAARRVGTAVHTVVTSAANLFPDLDYYPDTNLCDYSSEKPGLAAILRAQSAYDQLREQNRQRILATDVSVHLPTVVDSAETTESTGATCDSLYASAMHDGSSYTSIVSVDMTHPGPVKTATVISRAGAVYASADALYIAVAHSWTEGDLSTIHKFRISDIAGQTKYLASGSVHGRALNQFALDEQDGYLRIATTDGHAPDPAAVSYMTVLAEQHDDLVTVGEIGGIAPSEDIRSVRFDGNRAFVVTFKKTDPLFAFDLSNPTAPQKLGELKIPGFSTYMHMLDDTHLLTIGYDADDHDSFAYFDGIMLQIFDVSDMTAPALSHKFVIGTRGSSSEALTNHLAFTWYPEESLLALPMTVCEGGDDGTYGDTMSFNGLMVFDASVPAGFAEHGRVAHAVAPGITCGNWWSNAESTVKRSLFLDNFVYSISDTELKVRDIGAMSTELVTVPLH
jgi:uncharacterized secreted protein with C-terminal beta-propeller domain